MVTLFVIAAALLVLFLHALATLHGMTSKRLYPLLRITREGGRHTSLVTEVRRLADYPCAATPCRCRL